MLEIDRASAGRMIDRMEKNGWVERRPDDGDRRINRLHLTAEARKVHAAMWAIAEVDGRRCAVAAVADERAQFTELTAKVKGQLQALAGGRAMRRGRPGCALVLLVGVPLVAIAAARSGGCRAAAMSAPTMPM
jgi:hypothetical protein